VFAPAERIETLIKPPDVRLESIEQKQILEQAIRDLRLELIKPLKKNRPKSIELPKRFYPERFYFKPVEPLSPLPHP
jgi:hypothetical protein